MLWCEKCKVSIQGKQAYCPLCQNELTMGNETENLFPIYNKWPSKNHIIMKIINFIFLVVGIASIIINLFFPTFIWWGLIVVVSLICIRISLSVAISKKKNIIRYLLYQSIIISVFSLFIDYYTGKLGWSLTFVLPIIFTLAMITMYLLSKILRLQANEYMIYLLLDALFGVVPIFFLVMQWVTTKIPSLVCILVSISSVIALIVFEGKQMLSELKRRLHI